MRQEIKEYKRSRIIEEASKLFFERGYDGTSLDLLAQELGVTKPFIYSYFDNKNSILEAVHEHAAEQVLADIEEASLIEGGAERGLAEFIRLFVHENIRNQVSSAIFLREEKRLSEATLDNIREIERAVNKKLTMLIQRGIDEGVFHIEDASLASMSISGMVRWVHRWYQRGGRYSPDAIAAQLAQLGLNMVRFNRHPEG